MKKLFLLFVAAVGLSTTAKAQVTIAADLTRELDNAVVAPFEAVECEQSDEPAILGPMRGVANGIWYQRPIGTFLRTGSNYRYMIVPPFTELTWINRSSEPENTVWKYGATAQNSYREDQIVDNNFVTSYNKHTGTGASYGPFVMVENVDTFAIIDSQLSTGYPLVIAPDTISTLMNAPATVNYTGFSTFKYGTNGTLSAARDGGATEEYYVKNFKEVYRASGQPLYLESITLYARLPEGKTEPIAAGSEGVTCYVIQGSDFADLSSFTDTVAVIRIVANDTECAEISEYQEGYMPAIKAYCMKEDEFGGMTRQPAILDQNFLLSFEGFQNEGVDFTVNMSQCPDEESFDNGGPRSTYFETRWKSDDALRSRYGYYNKYNMQIRLNAMWDVVAVDEACLEMTAPVEGGQITAPGEDEGGNTVDYPGVYIQSVFPYQSEMSPMPSYEIENMPEWLSISSYDDQYYVANYGWTTVVNIEAAPLPEGEDGRSATLRFVSEMGAKSKEFTVTQGTPVPTAIQDVETATNENAAALEYNLAGQRVGKDYKGIVVKNGKKMIKF